MNYNFLYLLNGQLAYLTVGIVTANIIGSIGYGIWLFLNKGAANFYVKDAMRFLKLLLACFSVPIFPFLFIGAVKSEGLAEGTSPIATPMLIMLIVLFVAWIKGFVEVILHYVDGYKTMQTICFSNKPLTDENILNLLEKWKKELKIRNKIQIWYNDMVTSPCIFYRKGYHILMPTYEMSEKECSMAILHELVHLKNGDIYIKDLAVIISALHSFNPIGKHIQEQIKVWAEVECDLKVCEVGKKEFNTREYYHTILDLGERCKEKTLLKDSFLFEMLEKRSEIYFRVDMMSVATKAEQNKYKASIWIMFVAMFGLTIGMIALAQKVTSFVYELVLVNKSKEILVETELEEAEYKDFFEDGNIIYSDENIIDNEEGVEFTLRAGETIMFEVEERNINALRLFVFAQDKEAYYGYINEAGKVFYLNSQDGIVKTIKPDGEEVCEIFVKNMENEKIDIEMTVGKKALTSD